MEIQDLVSNLRQEIQNTIGPLKQSSKGWLTQNCKLCSHRGHNPDKRKRFGIMFDGDSIATHCFNCGFSSRWQPGDTFSKKFEWFLRTIGMSNNNVKKFAFEAYRYKNINKVKLFDASEGNADPRDSWNIISLPKQSKTIAEWANEGLDHPRFLDAVVYLQERKLLYPDDFYWTPLQQDRIIIPARYKGHIVSWTGRYIGTPPSKMVPRYILDKPDEFMYNLDSQMYKQKIIIAEGVFDAYLLDGVSPFGNTISQAQVNIIKSYEKPVIVLPDRDREGEELVKVALENNWKVSIPKWQRGIKDFTQATSTYGRVLAAKTVIDGVTSGFDAQLKRKMDKFE